MAKLNLRFLQVVQDSFKNSVLYFPHCSKGYLPLQVHPPYQVSRTHRKALSCAINSTSTVSKNLKQYPSLPKYDSLLVLFVPVVQQVYSTIHQDQYFVKVSLHFHPPKA